MKNSHLIPASSLATLLLLSSGQSSKGQTVQAPVHPQYASTYYAPPKPSVVDRLRSAGQNVGDFVRRKFYGEGAPVTYQQPVYQSPVGYRTQRYNLDTPAANLASGTPSETALRGTTGFQPPAPRTVPKYQTPPHDDEPVAPQKKSTPSEVDAPATTRKRETKRTITKSKEATTASRMAKTSQEAPTASKKRYTPAKPSTFAKAESKTSTATKKRVEEDPPTVTTKQEKRTEPSTTVHYDSPPKEPTMEARLKTDGVPSMSGGSTADAGPGISPTIGGTELDLTPKDTTTGTTAETKTKSTDADKPTGDGNPKNGGSFIMGKKGSKPGRVVSPYPPYNELDITGLPSGSLALDPTTQKVFQVP